MTTSQEWAERFSGFVPRDRFDAVQPMIGRPLDRKSQIERVIAVQGLSRAEAAEQVNGRLYEAREYLKRRSSR